MAAIEPIKIEGLKEFSRNLKKLGDDLPKALRVANNEAAEIIVSAAKAKVPRKSGRAAATLKAKSSRDLVRIQGGSKRASYYPWLDFGGRTGRKRSVHRPFIKQGRYIYPALGDNYHRFEKILTEKFIEVAKQAGVEVES